MSATAGHIAPPSGGERQRHFDRDNDGGHMVPAPAYRHATPSAPWPWMQLDVAASEEAVLPALPGTAGSEWRQYPQHLFENWTREPVERSRMLTRCSDHDVSTMYTVRVLDDGHVGERKAVHTVRRADAMDLRAYWNDLVTPTPSNVRVQALFVEEMTVPVLKMLGTRYNIEPFFFASSANWIPSRYQEDVKELEDHITVVLPFVRTLKHRRPIARTTRLPATFTSTDSRPWGSVEEKLPYMEDKNQIIDTQVPLSLPDNKVLIQDLLSFHMVRNTTTSTIISYHPCVQFQGTPAKRLHELAQRTGDSVYWSKIFRRSKDPTFLFLAILWYALYAWDEAFEVLFRYINTLESNVLLPSNNRVKLTRELHKLQAHILYYQQLLRDFRRSVEFLKDTPNPAMSTPSISEAEREDSTNLLQSEADNLISEIDRLTLRREILSERLDNAISLTFATVNIDESKSMRTLAETAMKDSSAVKQIGYITMVFLPGSLLANIFSMNVTGINNSQSSKPGSLVHFIATVVGLTLITSWLAIALQKESYFFPAGSNLMHRAFWPFFYANDIISTEIKGWRERIRSRRSPKLVPT